MSNIPDEVYIYVDPKPPLYVPSRHYVPRVTKEELKENPRMWACFFCYCCTILIIFFIVVIITLALEMRKEKIKMDVFNINSTSTKGYYKLKNKMYMFGGYQKYHGYCINCPNGHTFRFDCGYMGTLTEAKSWCTSKLRECCKGANCATNSGINC